MKYARHINVVHIHLKNNLHKKYIIKYERTIVFHKTIGGQKTYIKKYP